MGSMGSADVERAVTEMERVLTPYASRDWQVPAGSLDWTCWSAAAHVAHDLVAYAGQVAAQPVTAYLPFDLVIRPDASPNDVLQVVIASGRLLSRALAAAGPEVRAWHWGATDPGGFAALGVNETLVHTYDITQGLGVNWLPPEMLCAAVLARLFPDAPDGDPVQVLLWCTGRTELEDRPQVRSWLPRAALD
jgi:Mycothiol maleylpyruvate isomerase N-terminal domain